jgi:hypothetical protein
MGLSAPGTGSALPDLLPLLSGTLWQLPARECCALEAASAEAASTCSRTFTVALLCDGMSCAELFVGDSLRPAQLPVSLLSSCLSSRRALMGVMFCAQHTSSSLNKLCAKARKKACPCRIQDKKQDHARPEHANRSWRNHHPAGSSHSGSVPCSGVLS